MDYSANNTPTPSSHLVTPLLIAMLGILFTAFSVWIYHFFLTKHCMEDEHDETTAPERVVPSMKQCFNGVDDKVLECIPILGYSTKQEGMFRLDQNECAVCLGELEEGVMVRLLPSCRHAFHLQCIDQWFFTHSNCPLCRAPIKASMEAEDEHEEYVSQHTQETNNHDSILVSEIRRCGRLHPSKSLRLPTLQLQLQQNSLKRSLSMDYSCVSIQVKGDNQRPPSISPSSSSKKAEFWTSSSYRRKSFRRLDQTSSKLMKSLCRLCSSTDPVTDTELLPR